MSVPFESSAQGPHESIPSRIALRKSAMGGLELVFPSVRNPLWFLLASLGIGAGSSVMSWFALGQRHLLLILSLGVVEFILLSIIISYSFRSSRIRIDFDLIRVEERWLFGKRRSKLARSDVTSFDAMNRFSLGDRHWHNIFAILGGGPRRLVAIVEGQESEIEALIERMNHALAET